MPLLALPFRRTFLPSSRATAPLAPHPVFARAVAFAILLLLARTNPAFGLVQYQALDQMHHTSWSATDGLAGEPMALTQTSDGFLWIGTSVGLYRFDGVRFERYQPAEGSLPAAFILALAPAADGGLWVGYASGGVSLLTADGGITTYSAADSVPIGGVRAIAVDLDGAVWLAAVGGLARFENGQWHKIRMDWNYPCKSAWSLFLERDGTLWVGAASPDRIAYLPRGSREFVDIGANHSALEFIQVDDSTIGYSHQIEEQINIIRRVPGGATQLQVILGVPALAIALDREGGLWFGGYDIARRRLFADSTTSNGRLSAGPVERVKRSGEMITGLSRDVMVDREGTVWGITARGLDRFRHRNVTWVRDTIFQFGASLVADSSADVWLLLPTVPSIRRLSDGMVPRGAPEILDHGVLDRHGAIWITRANELLRWKDGRFEPIPPPQEVVEQGYRFAVITSAMDRAGRYWASIGGSGVFYRKDEAWTFVPVLDGRPDWAPIAVTVDVDDRVWLGYRDEIAVVQNGEVRVLPQADSLTMGPLRALRARGRQVWAGGETGLALLHGERFHTVHPDDRDDFGAIYGIMPTEEGIWLSSAIGIVHVAGTEIDQLVGNPAHRVHYELFDLESDLPDVLSSHTRGGQEVEGRDGVLWFLTHQGVAGIDPRRIRRNLVPPSVIIRGVTADDRQYRGNRELSLPPLTRTLRIEYTASSLAIPGRVRFRHRLEGWDNQWHDAGTRREVSYTDLRPGHYTLHVMASNNDGVWNDPGAAFRFTVAPAWYQTAWFRALALLSVVGLAFLGYRARLRQVATALTARFDERLAERTRIARELHDTLLQTVQASRIVAEHSLSSGDPLRLRQGMEQLTGWLGKAVTEGRGAVQTLRDSATASHDLAEALGASAESPDRPPELTVAVSVRGTPRGLHPMARDEIYRIGHEAIRNVHAHACATQLDIILEYGQEFVLRIADNGLGIDPEIAGAGKSGHFGLHGMRERAESIGASLSITGGSTGTAIILIVPGRSAFNGRFMSTPSPQR